MMPYSLPQVLVAHRNSNILNVEEVPSSSVFSHEIVLVFSKIKSLGIEFERYMAYLLPWL